MNQCLTTSNWNSNRDRNRISEAQRHIERKGQGTFWESAPTGIKGASKKPKYSRLFQVHENIIHGAESLKMQALPYSPHCPAHCHVFSPQLTSRGRKPESSHTRPATRVAPQPGLLLTETKQRRTGRKRPSLLQLLFPRPAYSSVVYFTWAVFTYISKYGSHFPSEQRL